VIVARTRAELARGLDSLQARGSSRRLGFVPTMGYLHEGHLALVDLACDRADVVAASIFVNPLQFAPGEDLAAYPRDPQRDLALLEVRSADLVFLPGVEDVYPGGPPRITVDPGALGERLCGAFRPGHFRGVLTVVAKLFGLVRPDLAVFGRKDFQQLALIERRARELELGVQIVPGPTVRERDGLAMSSRNSYLSPAERAAAPALARALADAAARFERGERSAQALLADVSDAVRAAAPLELQYADVVDPGSLDPVDPVAPGSVLARAAFCGRTRLIDTVTLGGE
jgi:pantoate--beta-alanine ligase